MNIRNYVFFCNVLVGRTGMVSNTDKRTDLWSRDFLAVYMVANIQNIQRYNSIYEYIFFIFFAPEPQLCISGPAWYGVQLAVNVSFLFEVANIFQPHVVEVVVLVAEAFLSGTAHRSLKTFSIFFQKNVTPKIQIKVVQINSPVGYF
jgi:hypothetical protein